MNPSTTQQGTRSGPMLPIKWIVLDVIGSMMLAFGLALMILDPAVFQPWVADPDEIGVGLVIVGVLFMVPLVAHLVGAARAGASGGPL